MLKSWVLVWYHSSPESGFGESMSVATVYGTLFRSAPCSAHSGIGLLSSFPITPSKDLPSPGPYRWPSMLSSERFSNSTTTIWSKAPSTLRELDMRISDRCSDERAPASSAGGTAGDWGVSHR